jgi:hypothetical protein
VETVNENYFIVSLLLLLSPIISANVCIIFYIDLFCEGSTHLLGIRADGLLSKSYTKLFLQVLKIEEHRKGGIYVLLIDNTSHAS